MSQYKIYNIVENNIVNEIKEGKTKIYNKRIIKVQFKE